MTRYTLTNVVRRYRESRTGRMVDAFRVPHLEIGSGEIVAVVGHNGSGKSTLLEMLAFLHPPETGRILLDGKDVWADGDSLSARRRCPLLLQRSVLFRTTVLRNVMYGLRTRGMSRTDARRRAMDALCTVRLDHLAHRGHRELSGGERQRVALARALVLRPDVLLLDEPTAHVDHENEHLIEEMIRQLHGRGDTTVVLASHDSRQAMSLADRVVTLVDGQLLPGPMDNLFVGTLRRKGAGLSFHGESDLVLLQPGK